ncbi:MAG: hypothetical protein ABI472_19865 [Ginsengibacter sp.]
MKLNMFYAGFFLLLAVGCKKESDLPSTTNGTGKLILVKGGNQSGVFGELLPDTIILKLTSSHASDHFSVTYSLLQGNGQVEQNGYSVNRPIQKDSAGTLAINWRMGCNNTVQKLRFYIYTDSSNYYFYGVPSDSITITANAVKPNGWCRSCGYTTTDFLFSKVIADNDVLYLVDAGLLSSTDGGLNWYKINGIPYSDEIMNAQFNSNHWAYVLTKEHGIYFSKDMKQWEAINTGLLDMRDPTAFLVEDTALFVSFYFDGPYRTINNGNFWKKLIVGSGTQRVNYIRRHPDGRLMLFDDWQDFKISADNGDTWQPAPLSSKYVNYEVYDFKIATDGKLYIGSGNATLAILDPYTYEGEVHTYYQWNASLQIINNITITGNNVYYLVNYNPVPGIYAENNGWNLLNVGFNTPFNYYYLKQNGQFLIGSQGWLYYHD